MIGPFRETRSGDGPLLAAAVHHGHELRDEVAELILIDDAARLRVEELERI